MASLFSKRKAKRIGKEEQRAQAEDEDAGELSPHPSPIQALLTYFPSLQTADSSSVDSGPVVRRPGLNAPKSKSKLRLSFNPAETESKDTDATDGVEDGDTRPQSPARNANSAPRSKLPKISKEFPLRRDDETQNRPTYSKDYLQELKNSTPSTPKDLSTYPSSVEDEDTQAVLDLDITTKFGPSISLQSQSKSRIPTAAEIQEKKDRRARLAHEREAATTSEDNPDYISLDAYDSDGEFKPQRLQVGTHLHKEPHNAQEHTRLLHDDEDIAEGFDAFVEDAGRVTLSKKGLRAQQTAEREAIRRAIEGGHHHSSAAASDADESDSDASLNEQYEAAQTTHGIASGAHSRRQQAALKPRRPTHLKPIPRMNEMTSRLKSRIQELQMRRTLLGKRRAEIGAEKIEVAGRKAHIQTLLRDTGEEFERVRREVLEKGGGDIGSSGSGGRRGLSGDGIGNGNGNGEQQRGLESLGTMEGGP